MAKSTKIGQFRGFTHRARRPLGRPWDADDPQASASSCSGRLSRASLRAMNTTMPHKSHATSAHEAALTQALMQAMTQAAQRRRSSVEMVQQAEQNRFERGRSPTVRPSPWWGPTLVQPTAHVAPPADGSEPQPRRL